MGPKRRSREEFSEGHIIKVAQNKFVRKATQKVGLNVIHLRGVVFFFEAG